MARRRRLAWPFVCAIILASATNIVATASAANPLFDERLPVTNCFSTLPPDHGSVRRLPTCAYRPARIPTATASWQRLRTSPGTTLAARATSGKRDAAVWMRLSSLHNRAQPAGGRRARRRMRRPRHGFVLLAAGEADRSDPLFGPPLLELLTANVPPRRFCGVGDVSAIIRWGGGPQTLGWVAAPRRIPSAPPALFEASSIR